MPVTVSAVRVTGIEIAAAAPDGARFMLRLAHDIAPAPAAPTRILLTIQAVAGSGQKRQELSPLP